MPDAQQQLSLERVRQNTARAPLAASSVVSLNQAAIFILLIFVEGMHFVFARLLRGIVPSQTLAAFYVMTVSALEMGVFAAVTGKLCWQGLRQHAWFYAAIGFFVAASTLLSYESVRFIDPGVASVLAKVTTLFNISFGLVFLHERLTYRQLLGGGLAIVGAIIIAFQPGDYLRIGSLIVVVSSLLYALHAFIVKRYGGEIEFVEFFAFRVISTALFLLAFSGLRGDLVWPSLSAWPLLILVGTIDVTFSRTLYYVTMRKMPLALHSILLTLSPVAAILLTLFLFQIAPTAQQLLGSAAVLAGMLMVTLRR